MIIKEIKLIESGRSSILEWKITGENDTVKYITHEELWYSLSIKEREEIVYKNLDVFLTPHTSINWTEYFVGRDININK